MRSESLTPPTGTLSPAPGALSPYAPAPYRVVDRQPETTDTVTLSLEPAKGSTLPAFLPGQFNMLYAFGVGEVAISISGSPAPSCELLHTVRAIGKVSTALTRARVGDYVGVRGPYGSGWPVAEAKGKDVLVVAGGLGLAPLRPLLYELFVHRREFGRIEIIYGARTPSDLVYYEEIQEWRRRTDIRFQVTVDTANRNWNGDVGVVTTRIPDTRFDPSKTMAFLCGPEIMMRFTAQALELRGVPDPEIWLSMERNMKCAIAQCGHCQYGPYFLCREGPVLPYDKVRPFLLQKEV